MPKKRKFIANMSPAEKEASQMKWIDLQRACISRGMSFDQYLRSNHAQLVDYFVRFYHNKMDNTRLDAFDEMVQEEMRKKGQDEPFIRLGYIGETDDQGNITMFKRIKKHKKPKSTKKRERNEKHGIWKGTKKELTYQCATEGIPLKETIERVMSKFPDAKEKSIGIWYKRCLKGNESKN